MGPIGGSVETPTSKEPVPLAESTRKEGLIHTNTPIEEKSKDLNPLKGRVNKGLTLSIQSLLKPQRKS